MLHHEITMKITYSDTGLSAVNYTGGAAGGSGCSPAVCAPGCVQ